MTTTYTKVPKAVLKAINSGSPIGMLLALTYAHSVDMEYTRIPKASGTIYTKVAKAT